MNVRELLARHPLFAPLAVEAREAVLAEVSEIHLGDMELLYGSGDRADRVFVLLAGALQIEYPLDGSQRGKVTAMLLAPGFLGECQVLCERAWSGTGVAVTDLIALGIRKPRFVELISAQPLLTLGLYFELAGRFLNAIESWRHEPAHGPELSVARYLLARRDVLAHLSRRDVELIVVRQVDLARATGIRPETVNRVLAKWAKGGVTKKEGDGVRLLDVGALQQIAESTRTPSLIVRAPTPRL
jgi:CRP-like cAMP-binding protein